MMSSKELEALSHSEFWDERYAKADGDEPTHEWFRAFDALKPFFEKHLFNAREDKGKDQKLLHLGSGDSVSDHKTFSHRHPGFPARLTHC